jgi:chorismate mutase
MPERPGGQAISESKSDRSKSDAYDFERLERVVSKLVAAYRHQRAENAGLRREVEQRSQRIRALDGKLLEANQKRQDVVKRIDELIAQIDQLDASFDSVDA